MTYKQYYGMLTFIFIVFGIKYYSVEYYGMVLYLISLVLLIIILTKEDKK